MKYFRHLKLPFEFDLSDLAIFDTDTDKLGYTMLDNSLLDANITDFFKSHGFELISVASFYTPPGGILATHVDLDKLSNICKFNFCYGARGSRMYWYTLKQGYIPVVDLKNNGYYVKSRYALVSHLDIHQSQCVYAASTMIGTPTIVNVGQPHSVINMSKEGRWNLCLMFENKQGQILEIDEAEETLKEFWL